MTITDTQVRKLMEEHSKNTNISHAAMKADVDRKTARKYIRNGKYPSQLKKPRTWRTREDPFETDWPEILTFLENAPELEAKILFEYLVDTYPDRYEAGQVRTFYRRVKVWKAQHGADKEVFFPQEHKPGEAIQTDFTFAHTLNISIDNHPFEHLLCHVVLPYSNWEWVTVCRSESMGAIKRGLQEAIFQLGKLPKYHQTDNSTAATHDLGAGKRAFNSEYESFMKHLGLIPRTIAVGKKNQNGDVEVSHRILKNRIRQYLLLRGSQNFPTVEDYEHWLAHIMNKVNSKRTELVQKELNAMRPLAVSKLPEYSSISSRVGKSSTIRIRNNTYSVPSRLIGEEVTVRIYDSHIEVYHAQTLQISMERLLGRNGHSIDYRHIIWSLVRKPRAFARYKYRDDLFPQPIYRRVYDELVEIIATEQADKEYVRILHLAASTLESDVTLALELLHEQGVPPRYEHVKSLVKEQTPHSIPELPPYEISLHDFDGLLPHMQEDLA